MHLKRFITLRNVVVAVVIFALVLIVLPTWLKPFILAPFLVALLAAPALHSPSSVSPGQRRWALRVMSPAAALGAVNVFGPCLALPGIALELTLASLWDSTLLGNPTFAIPTFASLGWVLGAYLFGFAASMLFSRAIRERLGHKRGLGLGAALAGVAAGVATQARSIEALVVVRLFEGAGYALLITSAFAIIVLTARRPRAVRPYVATIVIAMAVGPVVGGLLFSLFGWESIFYVAALLALVPLVTTAGLEEPSDRPMAGRRDLFGLGLLITGVGVTAWAISAAFSGGQGFLVPVVFAVVIFIVLPLHLIARRRDGLPSMLGFSVFADRPTAAGLLALATLAFVVPSAAIVIVFGVSDVQGQGIFMATLAVLPIVAGIALGHRLARKLLRRFEARAVIASTVIVASLLATSLALMPVMSYWTLPVLLVAVGGVATGIGIAAALELAIAQAGQRTHRTRVTGAIASFGGVLGITTSSGLVGSWYRDEMVPAGTAQDFPPFLPDIVGGNTSFIGWFVGMDSGGSALRGVLQMAYGNATVVASLVVGAVGVVAGVVALTLALRSVQDGAGS
jgi:DHA2 family multidrug resistance protein-like MFS transporter